MRHLRWSRQGRAGIAVAVLSLLAALLPAGSAAADPTRWAVMSTDVSPGAAPGYNSNSKFVAVLGASDGHVRVTREGRTIEDLGRPPGAPVGKLAISGSAYVVFALTRDGAVVDYNRDTLRWETLALGMIDLLASRSGVTVVRDQANEFLPDLYVVAAGGGVWRLHGDPQGGRGWEEIGRDPDVDALAERGSEALFEHTTGGEVRQWSRIGTTWLTVGSSFAFLSGDTWNLVATDPAGKPQYYSGRPGRWLPPAEPAGASEPFTPGGRAIANDYDLYYQTSTGEIFARRSFTATAAVVLGWVHLAAGPVATLAPHFPAETRTEATAVRADGTLTELTWATIRVDPYHYPFVLPDAETGDLYQNTDIRATDWSGRLGVVIQSGSLPPGITAGTTPHGELMLSGRPTATGAFESTLELYDSTGATFSVFTTIRVVDGPGPVVSGRHWANPTSSLTLVNCLSDRAFMSVWTREFTSVDSNPAWEDHGSAASRAGLPGCTATSSAAITYTPAPNHTVEVVGLDRGAPSCAGRNDPDLAGCVLFHRQITGKAGLAPEVVTLTG